MQKKQKNDEEFSYDVVSYPSFVIPQTNPDRLAAIAKMHGMNPAPAEKCRVLELGCATGTNLNWLAGNLPESEFIGIDLAHNHINEAEKNKSVLGLQNVSFYQADVLEISEKSFGKFDYIIAYGLFSWVPEIVRQKILSLYDELLNENGVGLISYNVYPGFYLRQTVREMMRFYTGKIENPLEKVQQGVAFIDFLTQNSAESPVYQEVLKYELGSLSERSVENIYHDDFSEINQPFYFTEFIAEAEKHNLKFLAEIDYFTLQTNKMTEEAANVIENISQNTIEYEQYYDFLKCRKFRQTLLCKKDVATTTDIHSIKLNDFYVSSLLKTDSPKLDLSPESFKQFFNDQGAKFEISHPLTKVVLAYLINLGSHAVTFEELIEKTVEMLQKQGIAIKNLAEEVQTTTSILLQLYSPSSVTFHTVKAKALDFVSEKPRISRFTHWQLTQGDFINNFYGVSLNVQDVFIRTLLNLLDGTRTREKLISELTENVRSNENITEKEDLLSKLPEILDRNLFVLAKMGFLVG